MKYLVNFSLPLFLFTIVAVKTLPAQQLPGKTFPELPVRPNLEDLQVYSVEQRYRADHVTFQQMYAGLPVEWAVYAVNMTKDGRVYYASGDYFDEVAVASTTPAISFEKRSRFG